MALQPTRMTVAEFLVSFPEGDGIRRELVDGEVYVAASPSKRHQILVGRLHLELAGYVEAHGGGLVLLGPMDVILGDDVFEPDLLFLAEGGDDPANPKNVIGPPALVIEVVSDERRDLRLKRELYERAGVPEYWALLPEADQVQVFRLQDGRYARPTVLEPGDTLTPAALPGLSLDVARLFRR